MSGQIDSKQDDYSDKLIKLLPAEGMAALTAINSIIELDRSYSIWIVISVVVVAVFVTLWSMRVRHVTSLLQLAFILVAYVLWATNIFWPWLLMSVPALSDVPASVPAVFSILYTLFIPFVFSPQAATA